MALVQTFYLLMKYACEYLLLHTRPVRGKLSAAASDELDRWLNGMAT